MRLHMGIPDIAKALCGVIFSIAMAVDAHAATIHPAEGLLNFILFTGEIDAQSPARLESALKAAQPSVDEDIAYSESEAPSMKGQLSGRLGATVRINADGGDVDAAIQAGVILRRYHATIEVGPGDYCASACVLVAVGAPWRMIVGRIGIHRPFSVSYSRSLSESEQQYRRTNAAVEQYLHTMNMPARLLEAMNSVPPDEIRWLTDDEMQDFGINVSDPIWQDRYDSLQAQSRGISKQEYYLRVKGASAQCGHLLTADHTRDREYFNCREAIMGPTR